MNPWLFPALIVGVVFLIFFVIPKFYRRKIQSVFMKPGSEEIYVLTNARSTTMTKNGIFENHRIFFNKANLATGEILFSQKIQSFSTKMLDGYARILGISDTHSFLVMSGNRIFITDNKTGKIVLSYKQLVKQFPELKKADTSTIQYDSILKTIILFDTAGYGHRLNMQTNSLEKFTAEIQTTPDKNDYQEIDTYGLSKFKKPDWSKIFKEDWRFSINPVKTILLLDKKGSKRTMAIFGLPSEKENLQAPDDFLYPQIVNPAFEKNALLPENGFLLLHFPTEDAKASELLVSRVSAQGKINWAKTVRDIFLHSSSGENQVLFFELRKNQLWLFTYHEHIQSNRFNRAVLSPATGEAIQPPVEIRF